MLGGEIALDKFSYRRSPGAMYLGTRILQPSQGIATAAT